ncbi:MAG: MFS transporter [Neisseriaceae bacterium]|nr:MFS transporter [Neisseriaceae bacterium]
MPIRISQRLLGKLLVTIFFLNIFEYLQAGMIAFSANPIMGEIGASPEEFGLVSAVYACIAVIMIAQQHWLVERIGWRRYIQIGLAFSVLGAVVCYFSHSFTSFLAGRAIMALGGASFMTSARLLTLLLPPGLIRFAGIKVFVVSMTLGMAGAPFLASLAVSHDSWNSVFLLLIGCAAIAWLFASFCLPTHVVPKEARLTQSNPVLLLLLLLGGFTFFYVFRRSSYNFYSNALVLLAMLVVAIVCLALFVRRLHRHDEKSLLRIRPVLQDRLFLVSTLFSCAFFIMNAASNYILPMLLQKGFNFAWTPIGQYMSIGLSMSLLAWIVFSKTVVKSPTLKKYLIPGGLCVVFYGWRLASLTPQASLPLHILPALMANGLFLILVMSPITALGFRSMQQDEVLFSHAMQLRNMIAQLALSLGIAFGTVFMQWRTTVHFSDLGASFRPGRWPFDQTWTALSEVLGRSLNDGSASLAALSQLQQMLLQQATIMAALDYFYGVMVFGAVVTVIFWWQKLVK